MTTTPLNTNRWLALGLLAILSFAATASLDADDRDLVREAGREPYLHIIFDVSGSMNWTPPIEDLGLARDSFAPAYGDDPTSKFYQAKSALFRVLTDPELEGAVNWGFGTYNQDRVRVYRKHWLYQATEMPPWSGTIPYPVPTQAKLFGDHCMDDRDGDTTCDLDAAHGEISGDRLGSCGTPQRLNTNIEDTGELLSFPVLGDTGVTRTDEWVSFGGRRFRIRWQTVATGNLGDPTIKVTVQMREARNDCQVWLTAEEETTMEFGPVYTHDLSGDEPRPLAGANEAFVWQIENHSNQDGQPAGFWNYVNDTYNSSGWCNGWDPNNDSGTDSDAGINLKVPTVADPDGRGAVFSRGDIIPLDWQDPVVWGAGNTNKDAILRRLAPDWDPDDPNYVPELRSTPYFQDHPNALRGTTHKLSLEPEYVNSPPMIPFGSTPIGASMDDFIDWYDTWQQVADTPDGDPTFGCRTVNLLILTDGDETCGGAPCTAATQLYDGRNVRTFVVGFGLAAVAGNTLDCIAQNGGTDAIDFDGDGVIDMTGPIYPGNEDELVEALKQIIVAIQPRPRSFAAAAVPQASANTPDKTYLTSFIPLLEEPVWPGRLDAYLRPVPTYEITVDLPDGTTETRFVPDNRPSASCGPDSQDPDEETQCHLWNAAEELLAQSPTDAQVLLGDYNLGLSEDQRRVYYPQFDDIAPRSARPAPTVPVIPVGVPWTRSYYERPSDDAGWLDLLEAYGICDALDTACGLDPVNRDEAIATLDFFHAVKVAQHPADGSDIRYALGDIFHSDPVVLGNPDNFRYWTADVGGSGTLPLEDPCGTSPNGYRCYFDQQQLRRKMVLLGSNSGQLHAFDAGIWRGLNGNGCENSTIPGQQILQGEFDGGTGAELFSYVPRISLPSQNDLRVLGNHDFTIDGRVSHADIFIDPLHDGIPSESDREWRSVFMGGMREGGKGYFAIDYTQPDTLDTCNGTPVIPEPEPGSRNWVPSCLDGGVGCGTLPLATTLWEFEDNTDCGISLLDGQCDDDANGIADLGDSWSAPVMGRILVTVDGGATIEDRHVAIFGGGMDPLRKGMADAEGNHLYMIDIETGRKIYKRPVEGSIPMEVAAVDTDQNGILDTIYAGTTVGIMYKVDISSPQALEDDGLGPRIIAEEWDPFPVFVDPGMPFYFPPSVIFVPHLGKYAIGWGGGDREDLWEVTQRSGRIYMLLDRDFSREDYLNGDLPLTILDIQRIDPDAPCADIDYLRQPPWGWYIELEEEERTLNRAFSLAGVTVISTYQPEQSIGLGGGVCVRTGDSRTFVVNTTSACGLLPSDDPNNLDRYFVIEGGFLSSPFVETGQTKNPSGDDDGPTADDIPDDLVSVMGEIRKLFPDDCKFANYTINIKAVRDDTGIQFLAAIPICTVETNWRDF